MTTSGTSGQPLGLRVTYAASAREWALMLDSWSRVGFTSEAAGPYSAGLVSAARENGARSERDPVNRALVLSGFDLRPTIWTDTPWRFASTERSSYTDIRQQLGYWRGILPAWDVRETWA